MDLGALFARREAAALARENVRVRVIGRRDRLPVADAGSVRRARSGARRSRSACALNLAVNYGARTELCDAIRALARDVAAGRLDARCDRRRRRSRPISVRAGMPDPDLLIRTGGDLRLSNFLLYQCAYTELMVHASAVAGVRRRGVRSKRCAIFASGSADSGDEPAEAASSTLVVRGTIESL